MSTHTAVPSDGILPHRRSPHGKVAGIALAAVTIVVLLSGCSPSGIEDRNYRGLPAELIFSDLPDSGILVLRGEKPGQIDLITAGSGNCPVLPTAISWIEPGHLEIEVRAFEQIACQGNQQARTSELLLDPEETSGDLLVTVQGEREEWRYGPFDLSEA